MFVDIFLQVYFWQYDPPSHSTYLIGAAVGRSREREEGGREGGRGGGEEEKEWEREGEGKSRIGRERERDMTK